MSFAEVLPLAVVMVAGPQIISAVFLATSKLWRRNSLAFISGALLSISSMVSISFFLGLSFLSSIGGSNNLLYILVLLLLVYGMIQTYLKRNVSKPPKWMGKLQEATPGSSFKLGFLLLGFFPTNLATSFAVGSYLSSQNQALTDSTGFISLTLLFLAIPSLTLLLFGEKAEKKLPTVRNWMNENSWIINEAVFIIFILLTLNNLI